jgi:hypothetical protein
MGICYGTDVSAAQCDDEDVCTTDTCDPLAGCVHAAIAGCCTTDAQCTPPGQCLTRGCVNAQNRCAQAVPVADCCGSAEDCDDGIPQTVDSCDLATGLCRLPCTAAAECDDDTVCTDDSCDVETGVCGHEVVAGCCVTGADCADGLSCIANACTSTADEVGTDTPTDDPGPTDPGGVDPGATDLGPPDVADDGTPLPDREPDVASEDPGLSDIHVGTDAAENLPSGGVVGGGCVAGGANPSALLPSLLLLAAWLGRRLGTSRRRAASRDGRDAR